MKKCHLPKRLPSATVPNAREASLFRDDQLHYSQENCNQLKKRMYFLKKLAIFLEVNRGNRS